MWAGNPAKLLREMEEGEAAFIAQSAVNYAELAAVHAEENAKTHEEIAVGLHLGFGELFRHRLCRWQPPSGGAAGCALSLVSLV